MTLESFATNERPLLQCAPPGTLAAGHDIRIRARRVFPAARDDLFAAWTGRPGWESWLRLRARSRVIAAPYSDGAFRLQLGEGPRIHVITGAVRDVRLHEFISLTWIHHGTSDHASVLDVAFSDRGIQSELRLVHRSIASRREAAWLMRLWASALDRLERLFADGVPASVIASPCASSAA